MDKDVVQCDTMEYYSAIIKNEMMPFAATWMDPEMDILSEVCQTKENFYMKSLSLVCGISKEMIQMNLLTKQKGTYRLRK